MEPEYSFPYSQEVTTKPNSEPFESSSHVISSRSLLILHSHLWLSPANAHFLTAFPTKMNCVNSSLPIWSYFYLTTQIVIVEHTDYEIPFVTQFSPYASHCLL